MKKEKEENDQCPRCKSLNTVKNGKIGKKKKQRYKCNACGENFFLDVTNRKVDIRRYAVILYLEGMNCTDIGRKLNICEDSVQRWISPMREHLDKLKNKRKPEINIIIEHLTRTRNKKDIDSNFIVNERKDKTLITTHDTIFSKLNNPYYREYMSEKFWKKQEEEKRKERADLYGLNYVDEVENNWDNNAEDNLDYME